MWQGPKTGPELLRLRAEERAQEIRAWEEHCRDRDGPQAARTRGMGGRRTGRRRAAGGSQRPAQSKAPITKWAELEWERRWKKAARTQTARGQEATTWSNPWATRTSKLYEGLPKYLATALLLLRTEVLGLNAWLARVKVPGVSPHCPCGWHEQTVRHVFFSCPRHDETRQALVREVRSEDLWAQPFTIASGRWRRSMTNSAAGKDAVPPSSS